MKSFKELTEKQKEIYRACLLVARFDEQKAVQYFNDGTVPLGDVVHLVNGYERVWHKALNDSLDSEDRKFHAEVEKVRINKKNKLERKEGAKITNIKRHDAMTKRRESIREFLLSNPVREKTEKALSTEYFIIKRLNLDVDVRTIKTDLKEINLEKR